MGKLAAEHPFQTLLLLFRPQLCHGLLLLRCVAAHGTDGELHVLLVLARLLMLGLEDGTLEGRGRERALCGEGTGGQECMSE